MKIIINFLVFCLMGYHATGQQTFSFETLDSISNAINKIQREAEGERVAYQPYVFRIHNFQISFPEDAFRYFYYNQRATQAYYRDDTLTLIEDLDLSMASNIYMPESDKGLISRVVVEFPADVKKVAYLNGNEVGIGRDDKEFDFFCKESHAGARYKQRQMFDLLIDIISRMKIAKKMITQAEANEWKDRGEAAMIAHDKATPLAYFNKYSGSYYRQQVYMRYNVLDGAERRKAGEERKVKEDAALERAKNNRENVLDFLDSLAASFHYKRGLTEPEFRAYNAEIRENMTDTASRSGYFSSRNLNKYPGPRTFRLDTSRKVVSYTYGILEGTGTRQDEITSSYLNVFRNSPAAPYLTIEGPDKYGEITAIVSHPLIAMTVRFSKNMRYGPGVYISFDTKSVSR